MQFYENTPEEQEFFDIADAMISGTRDNVAEWYETAYQSSELGSILFDNRLDLLSMFMPRLLYYAVYEAFQRCHENLQSVDFIYELIQILMGESEVEFTFLRPDAMRLNIDIIGTRTFFWVVDYNKNNPKQPNRANFIIADMEDNTTPRLIFDDNRIPLTIHQIRWIFKHIVFHGCYLELEIKED